jgi:hypothetical protein
MALGYPSEGVGTFAQPGSADVKTYPGRIRDTYGPRQFSEPGYSDIVLAISTDDSRGGVSGGPVINASGEVVAVIGAGVSTDVRTVATSLQSDEIVDANAMESEASTSAQTTENVVRLPLAMQYVVYRADLLSPDFEVDKWRQLVASIRDAHFQRLSRPEEEDITDMWVSFQRRMQGCQASVSDASTKQVAPEFRSLKPSNVSDGSRLVQSFSASHEIREPAEPFLVRIRYRSPIDGAQLRLWVQRPAMAEAGTEELSESPRTLAIRGLAFFAAMPRLENDERLILVLASNSPAEYNLDIVTAGCAKAR